MVLMTLILIARILIRMVTMKVETHAHAHTCIQAYANVMQPYTLSFKRLLNLALKQTTMYNDRYSVRFLHDVQD